MPQVFKRQFPTVGFGSSVKRQQGGFIEDKISEVSCHKVHKYWNWKIIINFLAVPILWTTKISYLRSHNTYVIRLKMAPLIKKKCFIFAFYILHWSSLTCDLLQDLLWPMTYNSWSNDFIILYMNPSVSVYYKMQVDLNTEVDRIRWMDSQTDRHLWMQKHLQPNSVLIYLYKYTSTSL